MDVNDLIKTFATFYSANKYKPELNGLTDFLLSETLKSRGYNNFRSSQESGESFFIKEILSKTDPQLCIDVGANIGGVSVEILTETRSNVIAFEPLPIAFQQLVHNTAIFTDRIVLENCGIGSKESILPIHYNPEASAHASFSSEIQKIAYINNCQDLSVPITTLDSYFKSRNIHSVDFIKIDVEGFESEVFEGAKRVISEIQPRFIQIEFNWHQLFRSTSLYYFSQQVPDYYVYQLLPDNWVRRDPKDPLSNIFHFSNFVFVRPDCA
jgi:FkbM family methyltransferase